MSAPKLRFKNEDGSEFHEWKKKNLGSIADVTKLAGYEFTKHIVYGDSGKIIALRGLNVKGNKLDLSNVKYIDKSDLSKLNRSKLLIDDLLFTYVGTIGEVALITENDRFYLAPNVSRIRLDANLLFPKFAMQYFNNSDFKEKQINLYIATSSQPALSMENIRKFEINLPSIPEQTKIANFLTAVDEKISQLTQKHELLSKYKKGVMQKIFSQELRFKDDDGSEFPEWNQFEIGDICKPQQWKTISADEFTAQGYPVYGANGKIGYYSEYNHEYETVGVTCRGATCGEVSLIPAKSYITGNSMSLDNIDNTKNNHRFVFYALSNRGFRDVISGSAQPQIVGSAIKKVSLLLPSIKEQNIIANFLTAIDAKITATQSQLELVKQYKQGLLQQMFI